MDQSVTPAMARRSKAVEIVEKLGNRLCDYFYYEPASTLDLADGDAGVLLLAALGQNRAFNKIATIGNLDFYLRRALYKRSTDFSLFGGWAGVYAATRCAYLEDFPVKPLAAIQRAVDTEIIKRVPEPFSAPETIYTLDLISGLAGMMFAASEPSQSRIYRYFSWLSMNARERLLLNSVSESKWYDVGAAHGIGGLVSSLALCSRDDSAVSTVLALSDFLVSQGKRDGDALLFMRTPAGDGEFDPLASWCYGGLGVAAALTAAAIYTKSRALLERAIESANAVTKPTADSDYWREPDLNLCHGTAGNGLILLSVAKHTGNSQLERRAMQAMDKILESYDPTRLFGFPILQADGSIGDSPGFLMGSLGIILALAAMVDLSTSSWIKLLGIPPLHTSAIDP